jgi:hypothetical protein
MSLQVQTNHFKPRKKGYHPRIIKGETVKRTSYVKLIKITACVISDTHKGGITQNLEDKFRLSRNLLLPAVEKFLGFKLKPHHSEGHRRDHNLNGKARRAAGVPTSLRQLTRKWVDNYYYKQDTVGKDGHREIKPNHPINTHRELYGDIETEYLKSNSRTVLSPKKIQTADHQEVHQWLRIL